MNKRHQFTLRILLVVLLSLTGILAQAQERTQQEAAALARSFFGQSSSLKSSSALTFVWDGEQATTKSAASPAFYVFNRGTDEGFVIVSGNKAAKPVLAYAMHGSFSAERMPDNVRAWMRAFKEHLQYSASFRDLQPMEVGNKDLRMTGEVDLNTPDYNQDAPYNNYCPFLAEGWRAYTGCAITATAIVMGHHRWPEKGTGVIPLYRVQGQTLGPYDLDNAAPYNWDNMEDIATIMVQLGTMVRAHYDYSGTSARLQTMATELPKYMVYNPRMHYEERDKHDKEVWKQMLRAEIDASRPVIYDGYDTVSGHAFVVDGYNDQGFFNINWGWGGYCNGFYDLEYLTPAGSGIGGNSSGGYSLAQGGIFEVRPRVGSDGDVDNVEFIYSQSFANGLTVAGMEMPVKKGDSFRVDAGIVRNLGTNTIKGDFKLVVADADGNVIEELCSTPASPLGPLSSQLVVDRQMVTITKDVRPGYRLRVVFKSEFSGLWIPVTCPEKLGKWEIILNDRPVEPEPPVDLEASSSIRYNKKSGKVTVLTLPPAEVSLVEKVSGKDYSNLLQREGDARYFLRSALGKGTYVLTIRLGSLVKEVVLDF